MTRQVNHNLKASLCNLPQLHNNMYGAGFSHHKLQWYQTGGMVGFIAYE